MKKILHDEIQKAQKFEIFLKTDFKSYKKSKRALQK